MQLYGIPQKYIKVFQALWDMADNWQDKQDAQCVQQKMSAGHNGSVMEGSHNNIKNFY